MNSDSFSPSYDNSLVKVVEYLESSMSRDLLCKFPDNSPFDFDYSQSSIWSPLIKRSAPLTTTDISKRLRFAGLTRIKDATASLKRKLTDAVSDNLENIKRRKTRIRNRDVSPRKRWSRVLKAASENMKKMKRKNGGHLTAPMNFPRCGL